MNDPILDHYNLQDLVRLGDDNNFTEKQLLQLGAKGKLQYSIMPSAPSNARHIMLTHKYIEENNFNPDGYSCVPCDYSTTGCFKSINKIFKISKNTVERIYHNETIHESGYKTPKIKAELLSRCNDNQCQFSSSCFLDHEIIYDIGVPVSDSRPPVLFCNRTDLIVTSEDIKAYNEKDLDSIKPTETIPPYLDPENEFYSVTLDIAVQTWKAIFEDKKYLDEASAANAGKRYIMSQKEYYHKLLNQYDMNKKDDNSISLKLIGDIARIATGDFSSNKMKWNKFRDEK
ncbi:MAG: hypothetical protein PF450_12780 [Bacteroidales bacterium]|jgi:hypothetical protein|nr:hypothetical protein [Bacteroidales bacterium]